MGRKYLVTQTAHDQKQDKEILVDTCNARLQLSKNFNVQDQRTGHMFHLDSRSGLGEDVCPSRHW